MKPRTKLEKLVVELSSKLPAISEAKKKWAIGLFPINGFYLKKGEIWCQCCGYVDRVSKPELAVSLEIESHICPQCGRCLNITHLSKVKYQNEERHISFIQALGNWNVIRTFRVQRINSDKGEKTAYKIGEIYQNWINEQGREVILTRPYSRSVWHTQWSEKEEMMVGRHNYSANSYYVYADMFDTDGNFFYPRCTVTKMLKRNGWRNDFIKRGVPIAKAIIQLLTNPTAETIVKQGQIDVFRYMLRRGDYQIPYRYALNICHRNGYIIKDGSLYDDYLHLLDYFHLDIHNAHYVCPKNLKKAHDELLERKRKKEAKERAETDRKARIARMERMKADIAVFIKRIQPFMGLVIKDDDIVIRPLESVTQFYQEGKSMHHCVYQNEYYKRKDCLILSAKVNGKRMETVEVSLKTFKIIQSRAVCNGVSKYHNKIVELMNNNMNLIRQCV